MSAIRQLYQHKKSELFVRHLNTPNRPTNVWLENAKSILTNQIGNVNANMNSIAFELCMSERQFYRKFKKITGVTPNIFFRTVRLEKAYELLVSGEFETLTEVAIRVGYQRVDYFSNLFEKHYNKRPSEILNWA